MLKRFNFLFELNNSFCKVFSDLLNLVIELSDLSLFFGTLLALGILFSGLGS
jgi:hypothetical protein